MIHGNGDQAGGALVLIEQRIEFGKLHQARALLLASKRRQRTKRGLTGA